ncbi:hypothetical protein F503_08037 [Ophiostoma piceae UAMH 11346]|uniref:Uncharacterized protein n=1 Tax=Ophiostoma piceae (strain UAMH 11346) TaxID=1262450 RepID=S3C677_OPHP1|nr:hypothetical protein F503_08037 [Ophiostoma piceae UAMH 11346]
MHHIVGSNLFNASMAPALYKPPAVSSCTCYEQLRAANVYVFTRHGSFRRMPRPLTSASALRPASPYLIRATRCHEPQGERRAVRPCFRCEFVEQQSPDSPFSGKYESGGAFPASHAVQILQAMLEVMADTRQFDSKADWLEDGS